MNVMSVLNPAVGLAGVMALALSATMAFAEVKETLKIQVTTDDGIAESVTIDNLPVGASEVFVTESGNEVLATRLDDRLELEVNGRLIEVKLPDVTAHNEGAHGTRVFIADHDLLLEDDENVWIDSDDGEVKVINTSSHHVVVERTDGPLSEEELAAIIHEHTEGMDVTIDAESGGDSEVIIIKKRVITVDEETEN